MYILTFLSTSINVSMLSYENEDRRRARRDFRILKTLYYQTRWTANVKRTWTLKIFRTLTLPIPFPASFTSPSRHPSFLQPVPVRHFIIALSHAEALTPDRGLIYLHCFSNFHRSPFCVYVFLSLVCGCIWHFAGPSRFSSICL